MVGWGGNQLGELNVPAGLTNAYMVEATPYSAFALIGERPPRISAVPNELSFSSGEFCVGFASRIGQPYFIQRKNTLNPDTGWTVIRGLAAKRDVSTLSDPSPTTNEAFYIIRARPSQ